MGHQGYYPSGDNDPSPFFYPAPSYDDKSEVVHDTSEKNVPTNNTGVYYKTQTIIDRKDEN